MAEMTAPPPMLGSGASAAGSFALAMSHAVRQQMLEGEAAAANKREQIAQRFEAVAKDPRYSHDPSIADAAINHAVRLRTLGVHEKLPKEYQADRKTGWMPAMQDLVLRGHASAQNAPAPQLPEPPQTTPEDFDRLFTGAGAGAPAGPVAAAPSPGGAPGGAHVGPNAVSPSPVQQSAGQSAAALPPPPPPLDHPGLPAGFDSRAMDPIAAAHMQAQVAATVNSTAVYGAVARGYGVPDGTLVDLRQGKIAGQVNQQAHKAEIDLRKKNMAGVYDESGQLIGTRGLKPEEMSPTEVVREQYMRDHSQLFDAQSRLTELKSAGLTPGTPQWDFNERKLKILEQAAQGRASALEIMAHNSGRADQVFTRDTFGYTLGADGQKTPVPGAMVDPSTGQTFGLKVPGTKLAEPTVLARNKADQGRVIINQGNDLIRAIRENSDRLGAWDGRVDEGEIGLGIADPVVRNIYTRLKSYAALQPQLHGARGVGYQKEFETAIGHLKDNPDSVIASVNALNSLGGEFVQQVAGKQVAHAGVAATAPNGPAAGSGAGAGGTHPVSKAEWNALINRGHTPADLKASGIYIQGK